MPSKLYQSALASLSEAEQTSLTSFESWLEVYTADLSKSSADGGRILENIRHESHLVGEGEHGNGASMATFLKECASSHVVSSEDDSHEAYKTSCAKYQGWGLKISSEHLPDRLLRYSTSRFLVAKIVERILGVIARDDFQKGFLSLEDAFVQISEDWDARLIRDNDRHAGETIAFATFEHNGGAPRNDAIRMTKALALPFWQRARTADEILVELSYPTAAVSNTRFPTVADAGWIHLFRPAPESEPRRSDPKTCWGWTEPLDGQPAQPEIVHGNNSLKVVDRPPRLVGRIPV